MPSRTRRLPALVAAVAVGPLLMLGGAPAHADTAVPLFVSEIVANNDSHDTFEHFEVTNTTDAAISLADSGISFAYAYVDSDDTSGDVPLTVEGDVTIGAGESVVFWLSYTNDAGTLDSFAYTVEDFRAHVGADASTHVVRVTGQPGMANGGDRAVRILDGNGVLTWSHYPGGSMGEDLGVEFQVPAASGSGATVLATRTEPTPGFVAPEALVPAEPDPEPEPEPPFDPQPDADLVTAPLQVTEVLPDSTNVGTADGYEFIELYNATSEPVDFSDYAITYLYPQDYETNNNEAHWPSVPRDVTIPAGDTLVLWIKNGQNDDLGDAEFNAQFGTDLTLGTDLVEIFVGGMANGSARGIDIRTNTGFSVNRAYYNMGTEDQTSPNQGIRYAVGDDLGLQQQTGIAPATPGTVQADQAPDGLMIVPADGSSPQVEDLTVDEIDPTGDFTIELELTDDVRVRTATLELRSDVAQAPTTVNLLHDGDDQYRHVVTAADLTGKAWYEYTVTVTDGTNVTRTETVRVPVAGAQTDPVRLNVADGDYVGGTTRLSGAGETYPPDIELSVDGERVATQEGLEAEPQFVFEVSGTDFYFRNGVRIGEEILHIFDEGTYADTVTMSTPVPLAHIEQGEALTLSIWAGTKAAPEIDEDENNDDFVVSGMRLVLPDGRTLSPAGYDDPSEVIRMGDSAGKHDYFDSVFSLPRDAFTAAAHAWDTTAVADGEHVVSATDGANLASATVVVDNTAPVITPTVETGETYQGEIVLDADITDGAGSGVESVHATLDGEEIELGLVTSSTDLEAGQHELAIESVDALGNTSESATTFTVPEEQPGASGFSPADGAEVEPGDVTLRAQVDDPTGDDLDVAFREGYRLGLDDAEVTASSGVIHDAAALDRDGIETFEAAPAADVRTTDGLAPVSSDAALPYYQFEVQVPEGADADATARLTWDGTADGEAQVTLYARSADGASWTEVDGHLTGADGEEFQLSGVVTVADHAHEGVITALVQHSEGFAGPDLTDRSTAVDPGHPEDTPRSEYDFTIAWESDTQYYNEEFYDHQVAIHDYVLERREELNLQYLIHTGDIVDDYDQPYQWENADPQYARLDEAGLPYGVLAGNHDVGSGASDYTQYSQYFGEGRYAGNPWYGGSYEDNRGHYDLVTAGGIDFLMLYMGWDPGQDAIDWMNDVLAQYPDRVAVVNLHEFMLTTGGLGPIPQKIMDEVVATNPNVRMVLSGHYHDAYTRVDEFDDDGDGAADRTVHSMLFDYQGLPEGGLGFLRLLHFDNQGEQMTVRTFSPSLDQYNSDEQSLLGPAEDPYVFQDFSISYEDLGIDPQTKSLATEAFTAEILTTTEIESFDAVPSGSVVEASWTLEEPGEHGWYVATADAHGGVAASAVHLLTVGSGGDGDPDDGSDDGAGGGSDGGSDGGSADGGNDGSGAGPDDRPDDGTGDDSDGGADDGADSDGSAGSDGSGGSDDAPPGGSAGASDLPDTGAQLPSGLIALSLLLVAGGVLLAGRARRA